MSIKLQLFGVFRSYAVRGAELELELSAEISVKELRAKLMQELPGILGREMPAGLMNDVAFGNEKQILLDTDKVQPGMTVALLPPVCGG